MHSLIVLYFGNKCVFTETLEGISDVDGIYMTFKKGVNINIADMVN